MSLIAPTANPLLEQALLNKLHRREQVHGNLGELESVALRLGLLQHSLRPHLREPQLVLFAADHGLAVDGIHAPPGRQIDQLVAQLVNHQLPVAAFARQQGMHLSVVDCGVAVSLAPHERLISRKIAHGTRNARVGAAMSLEQAHAAIRAGMEIGDSLRGNVVACAGLGLGSHESAALVLSRLTDLPLLELMTSSALMNPDVLAHLMSVVQAAQARHRDVTDAVEVLAAFGGFETGVMVGVMLVAASKRHLIMVDGMAACAALLVASRIADAVPDYCVFCRSQQHLGLTHALGIFNARALLDLGLDTNDGTGACLSWPLVNNASAMLASITEDGLAQPFGLEAPAVHSLYNPDDPSIPGVP